MTCCDLRRYLSAYIDSELDARTSLEVSEHLDRCDDCAARFEGEARLEHAMRERLNAGPVRPEFWDEVDAALAGAVPPRSAPREPAPAGTPGRWWVPAAAAAALTALLFGSWAFVGRDDGASRTDRARPAATRALVDVLAERAAEMERDGIEMLGCYRDLPDAHAAKEFLAAYLPPTDRHLLRVMPNPAHVAAHQLKLLGGGLSHLGDKRVPVLHYRCCDRRLCVFFIVPAALELFPQESAQLAAGRELLDQTRNVSVRPCPNGGGVLGVVGSGCSDSLAAALVAP